MELFIILGLTIIVLVGSITLVIETFKEIEFCYKCLIYTLFAYSFIVFLLSLSYVCKPRAIDVYKGKTTLEITYKDRVPIDSTVVWKKLINENLWKH